MVPTRKSTLLNKIAKSDVYVADQLFATLDPTTRRVELPGGYQALFTDTVGFIQKLPTTLIESFHATLEEIVEIMTWAQLGHHRKPMAFVNVKRFWDPMLALVDHMRAEGFVHTAHLVKPLVIDKPEAVVPAILTEGANIESPQGVSAVIDRM